jgi:predicted PurR-regulated permease PerM
MPGQRIFIWIALVLATLFFLYLVSSVVIPFLVAITLAAMLEPLVQRLRGRGVSRPASVYLVVGGFVVIAVGLGSIAAPSMVHQVSTLTVKAQDFSKSFAEAQETEHFFVRWNPVARVKSETNTNAQIDQILSRYRPVLDRFGLPTTRRAFIEKYVDRNRPQISRYIQSSFNSLFGILTHAVEQLAFVFLVPLIATLILLDMDTFQRRAPRLIPPSIRAQTMQLLEEVGDVFFKYLRGTGTVIALYGACEMVIMLFCGVPYAILLGVIFGILYLIPFFGNIISAIAVFCIVGFSNLQGNFLFSLGSAWSYATLVVALYLLVGFAFDHFIYPKMVGNSVGLSPVVSIFVILCGQALFGLPGMLIAFPLAGSLKVILDRLIRFTSVYQEDARLPSVPMRHRKTTG